MAVTDGHNTRDYSHQGKLPVTIKALYFAFAGYVKGGAANSPLSVPGRLANLGFGFFVLITLASYTANLTTVLVSRGSISGIASMKDAIDRGLTICVNSEVLSQLAAQYPNVTTCNATKTDSPQPMGCQFVGVDGTESIPRSLRKEGLRKGLCDVAIMQETAITMMYAGNYSLKDCDKAIAQANRTGEDLAKADADWGCERDNGMAKADRDCYLTRVGGLVMSVPLSVPVRTDLLQSLSWALRKTVNQGTLAELKESYSRKLSLPVCGVDGSIEDAAKRDPIEQLRLKPHAMIGTTAISIIIMVIAVVLAMIEMKSGRNMQTLMGFENPYDPDVLLDGKEPRKWRRKSLGSRRGLSGGPEEFSRLASQASLTTQLQSHKLNEIHRMLVKLSGEDMAVDWKPDDVQISNQIMPYGTSSGSVKGLRPLPLAHSASIRSAKSGCSGASHGMPHGPSAGSSRTLRTVSAADSSNPNAPEECALERGKMSGQEGETDGRKDSGKEEEAWYISSGHAA
mmetsp:Transcript_32411/g.81669  ORF Transcript_32411/g.81669 Transcript_32411/m.81669 type:complete len:512 (+) Transcript_32411:120-1655(+)